MLTLLAPATGEPRPVERSVARRPGIVFTTFDTAPESGGGFPRCWNSSPPPSSAARSAMKSVENRYFVAEKLLKLVAAVTSGPFTSRFGGVGLRHFETHGPCAHKMTQTLLIFERVQS